MFQMLRTLVRIPTRLWSVFYFNSLLKLTFALKIHYTHQNLFLMPELNKYALHLAFFVQSLA